MEFVLIRPQKPDIFFFTIYVPVDDVKDVSQLLQLLQNYVVNI